LLFCRVIRTIEDGRDPLLLLAYSSGAPEVPIRSGAYRLAGKYLEGMISVGLTIMTLISACTEKVFSRGLLPLAFLWMVLAAADNDNDPSLLPS
jgi:hypothetical protein